MSDRAAGAAMGPWRQSGTIGDRVAQRFAPGLSTDRESPGPDPTAEGTRVLLIRHGETDWNVAARIQGGTDMALNARGRWQAQRLARALAADPPDVVYSSDLLRAHATAAAVAAATGAPHRVEPGLRERGFGDFEGLTFDEIARRWPEASERWRRRDPGFGPAGGERLIDFAARSVEAAGRLAAAYPGRLLALVAHGGVLDSLYRAATGLALEAPRTWQSGNAEINRLLWNGEGFVLVSWGDTAHLEGAEEPPGPGGADPR